ncbi:hypothetical protein CVT26_007152 [Gymnopilus dilepis]|uniref:Uncharacterized protein n=1 Tax=Gymnopilus dilepis TaxID=231916 RepID=A0A409W6J7_9AGAR|nr:hypothetical protein CVT26_007152 [Gymnopilus dilepis]
MTHATMGHGVYILSLSGPYRACLLLACVHETAQLLKAGHVGRQQSQALSFFICRACLKGELLRDIDGVVPALCFILGVLSGPESASVRVPMVSTERSNSSAVYDLKSLTITPAATGRYPGTYRPRNYEPARNSVPPSSYKNVRAPHYRLARDVRDSSSTSRVYDRARSSNRIRRYPPPQPHYQFARRSRKRSSKPITTIHLKHSDGSRFKRRRDGSTVAGSAKGRGRLLKNAYLAIKRFFSGL